MTLYSESPVRFQTRVEGPLGFERVEMALDTGASVVVIPTSVAHSLGYSIYQPEETLPLTTPSGLVRAPIITLSSVEVFGAVATGVRAACMDMPLSIGVGGLLGLSFLRNFDVDLHFRSGVIRFNS